MKAKKHLQIPTFTVPLWWPDMPGNWRSWLPSRGNVLFTLLVVAGLLWAQSAGALPQSLTSNLQSPSSTGTIAYQGRLADSAGTPITDTVNMEFRLYDVADGGAPLWSELWTGSNAVRVSDGLFNVMLGSLTPIEQEDIAGHDQLWLGITVGTDEEMTPRVQLGSVPFAVQALTVPDGSVTTAKIADGAVTSSKVGFRIAEPVSPNWLPTNTCVDLIQALRDRGYSSCVYASSPGYGWRIWHSTTDCSGAATEEPSVWQKRNIYHVADMYGGAPTYVNAAFVDQFPYLVCVK